MKRICTSIVVATLVGAGSLAHAQVAETFSGLNPADVAGSSSSLAGGAWTAPYGSVAPNVIVTENASDAFPLASTDFFLSYGGNTEQLVTLTTTPAFEPGDVLQFSMGLRFDQGPTSADQENNFVEIIGFRGTNFGEFQSLFGLSIVDGDLTTNPWNGFSEVVLEGAFDPASANFLGNDWHLVVGYVAPASTNGEVELRIYEVDGNGPTNLVASFVDDSFANTRLASFFDQIDFGLRNAFPDAGNDNQISVAELTIYPTADFTRSEFFDQFDTEPTSVSDWMLH